MDKKPVFKKYEMHQPLLLPPSLEELIPENHIVKTLNQVVSQMDLRFLYDSYEGGGASSFHPEMMLKVLLYAYTQRIYSCRMIAKSLRENINFMWLSGNNRPNFRTINRFRLMLKNKIDDIFSELLMYLNEQGFIKLENYFIDGTKLEANSNKYSFVWKKSTNNYKKMLKEKVKILLEEIESINCEEDNNYGDKDLEELGENIEIDSQLLTETVNKLNAKLNNEDVDKVKKKVYKKAFKKIEKDYLPRMKKYENYEKILNGRNSFSKTDTDATFMRLKEDHMKNGQLKAAYNAQIGTENQFIVGFSIHQKAGDTSVMIPHLEKLKKTLKGKKPKNIISDAGYGSEENYDYLEKQDINAYVKYNTFHYEKKKKFKDNKFRVENLKYDETKDEFTCPAGKKLKYVYTKDYKTDNGYQTNRRCYQCEDCTACVFRSDCHRSKYNRTIQYSPTLAEMKTKARENLNSEKGIELRKKRGVEVESVFGHIKQNSHFRRFSLRGLKKVNLEWGLISIAHNIKKITATCT